MLLVSLPSDVPLAAALVVDGEGLLVVVEVDVVGVGVVCVVGVE